MDCAKHGFVFGHRVGERESMDAAWRPLVNETAKLDALVDAMAKCLGKVLSIRDDQAGGQSLGKVLYAEKEYFPTREHLDEIDDIGHALAFCDSAHNLALRLCSDARHANVLLAPFARSSAFLKKWEFMRLRGGDDGSFDGSLDTQLPPPGFSILSVGALRSSLCDAVERMVHTWLLECDRAMMDEFDDARTSDDEEPLRKLVRELSLSIARRICMFTSTTVHDELSTRVLQNRAEQEITRNALQSEERQRADVAALHALEALAVHGPTSQRGIAALRDVTHLRHLVERPPVELGLTGSNANHMNLQLLARACESSMDFEVRAAIATQWRKLHGSFASTAVLLALQKLECRKGQHSPSFLQVLQQVKSARGGARSAGLLPKMPFVNETALWKLAPHSGGAALDHVGRRIVRLTSMVLQLLAHGSLERGVVNSDVVAPIATQAVLEARVVRGLLMCKLESYSLGTTLLRFCEAVCDVESHLSRQITDAMLHLARFSTLEILSIFSPQSPALRVVMDEFSVRTRGQLTCSIPPCYVAFAYDALAVLLPAVYRRRESVGFQVSATSTPICLLLRQVAQVREWSPLAGSLRLELPQLAGHKMLVELLRVLARRKLLVEWKRPYVLGRHAAKHAFVFRTQDLVEVLSGRPLLATPTHKPQSK
jgi:hypothetical protein